MVSFKKKEIIKSDILGEILKQAREENKIDLREAEQQTQIQKKYLEALENGQYDVLPSDVYAKNFLKTYIRLLGLEFDPLFDLFQKERVIFDSLHDKKKNILGLGRRERRVVVTPRLIKISLAAIAGIVLLVYLGLGVNKIFSAPALEIISPADKLITKEEFVKVEGRTAEEASVNINGQEVSSDNTGYFEKTVDLQKGINIIKITAVKKHSRENTVYREVLVE